MDTFDAVFEAQHARLLRIAGLLTGDGALPEEVVAEAFAKVFGRWRRGRIDDVGAYLRRAVINEVNGVYRKRGRALTVTPLDGAEATAGPGGRVDDRDELRWALTQLNPLQRAALVLRFIDDLSVAEKARVLDVPVGTVKSSVARGLERLRPLLIEEDPERA